MFGTPMSNNGSLSTKRDHYDCKVRKNLKLFTFFFKVKACSVCAKFHVQFFIQGFIHQRGMALREITAHNHKKWMIPSGMNLGGYCMLRMTDSVL